MSLDDIYTPASIHPGSAIFAAALAAGEWQDATGATVIEAAVSGYETTLRIADAVGSLAWLASSAILQVMDATYDGKKPPTRISIAVYEFR